ncbi:MAG: double zinc ribbon domain-containing protein, partial [Geminicoccaceae bacterium]
MTYAISRFARLSLQTCLDALLPPRCLGCGLIVDGESSLCADCWRGLTFLGPPLCRTCGYP